MAKWTGVITNSGNSLLNAWVGEKTLRFDCAKAGTGTVEIASLMAQTDLVSKKQDAGILNAESVDGGIRMKLRVTASQEGYLLNQFGVWASVDGNTALIAIFQHESGVSVPSIDESPDFSFTFYALIMTSNTGTWTVNIDTSGLVNIGDVNKAIEEKTRGFLPVSGGSMTGAINMNGKPITGLSEPKENNQAANKGYTDTKADLPKTVSGTVISLDDASDGALQGLRIYGKTTQDGTPTPEAPVELVSVGSSGSIAVSVGTSQEDTSPQTLTLSTPNGLPGIPVTSSGNYIDETGQQWICDEVDFARGVYVQRVKKLVFNGTEAWVSEPCTIGTRFRIRIDDNISVSGNGAPKTSLCNYVICGMGSSWNTTNMHSIGDWGGRSLFVSFRGDETIESFGALLAETNMVIVAMLNNPIETPIPSETIAAYAAIHTNKPNTTVYNDAGAHMVVGYYTPNATMLQADIAKGMGEKLPKTGGTMTGDIEMSGKKVTGLGTPTADADAVPKSYAVDMKQSAVTLSHSGWSNGAITVSVDGVTEDTGQTAVITTAAAESVDAYLDSGVKCSGQGAGTITFICTDTPSEDLTVNVLILKKGGWAS